MFDMPEDKSGCNVKGITLIIGTIIIIGLIIYGVHNAIQSIGSIFENAPWYICLPLAIIIPYTIYKIGEHYNIW